MSKDSCQHRYEFCGLVLDPDARRLTRRSSKGQQTIEVQSLVFDLLHFLVQRPDQVISKDDLLASVWKNQHLTDSTITQAVKKARQAVGDDGQRQQVIRTVHGKGIRLVVPVRVIEARPLSDRGRRWTPLLVGVGIVVLAAGLSLVTGLLKRPNQESNAAWARIAVFPFENQTGDEDLAWLEHGLADTTSLLLEQTAGLQVRHPQLSAKTEAGDLRNRARQIGAEFGLSARVSKDAERFHVHWQLSGDVAGSQSGNFHTADATSIARLLSESVVASMTGQPASPIRNLPMLRDPLAMELYGRGMEAFYREDLQQATTLLAAALVEAPDSVAIQFALAEAQFDTKDTENSLQRFRELIADLPAEASFQRAQLAMALGDRLWYEGQIEQAEALLREAQAAFSGDAARDDWWLARTLNSLGFVMQSQSRFDEAWELTRQAELLMRAQQDPYHLSYILTNLGYLADDLGRIREAAEFQQQALQIRSGFDAPSLIAASQYALARIERRSGNFSAAAALLDQSLATVTRLERPYDQFDNLEELAEVRARQNQIDEARGLIRQARSIAEAAEDSLGMAWADQVMTRLALREENADEQALQGAMQVIAQFEEMGEAQDAYIARLELAQLHILRNELDAARALLGQVADSAARENPALQLHEGWVVAQLAQATGDTGEALQRFQELVSQAREIGALDLEAEAAIELGLLAAQSEDLELANRMATVATLWSPDYYRTRQLASVLEQP